MFDSTLLSFRHAKDHGRTTKKSDCSGSVIFGIVIYSIFMARTKGMQPVRELSKKPGRSRVNTDKAKPFSERCGLKSRLLLLTLHTVLMYIDTNVFIFYQPIVASCPLTKLQSHLLHKGEDIRATWCLSVSLFMLPFE